VDIVLHMMFCTAKLKPRHTAIVLENVMWIQSCITWVIIFLPEVLVRWVELFI